MKNDHDETKNFIRKRYQQTAQKNNGCCDTSCCTDHQKTAQDLGYSIDELKDIPDASNMGLGCGNPLATADLKEGDVVLDLGSGGGFDCFIARKMVGTTGKVIGVDMTWDMISLARKNAQKVGYENVEFRLGEIEHLPVADNTVDVIISNCVINLSLDKQQVFDDSYRVLKPKGKLSISDVMATAPLPEDVKNDLSLRAGCIAGAEFIDTIKDMLHRSGFKNITITPKDNSQEIIKKWTPLSDVHDYVASFIIEAYKE